MKPDKWIMYFNKPANPRARLFCFPYAGGSAQTFRTWSDHLPADVQVAGIQLPGRSSRFTEPLMTSVDQVLEALTPMIQKHLDRPFYFFGHSMGAALCYELARLLQAQGHMAQRVFVSGRKAAHLERERDHYHLLPEPEFRKKLDELNGTPPEILEHEELMELMAPIVRADFAISETYAHHEGPALRCPLTAMGGEDDDEASPEEVRRWIDLGEGPVSSHIYPGDHFFINGDSFPLVMKQLTDYLV